VILIEEAAPVQSAGDLADRQEDDFGQLFLRGGIITFVVVLALLALTIINSQAETGAILSAFTIRFLSLFIEAAPYLLLGTLVSGLIDTFVSTDHIARWVPRNRFLGILAGTFAGFAFPVCECGVVPVVRQLYTKRLPMHVGIAFLLAAPVMNPIVLLSTASAFGFGSVLIGRYVITAVVAIGASLIFALFSQRLQLRGADPVHAPSANTAHVTGLAQHSSGIATKLGGALHVAVDEFFEMGRYLIIGSMLAAGMQTLVSQDVLLSLGQGPVISVIVMQLLAFVLSVCSTVDAFLALAFAGTFTTGSILAFLTFGPMVDIKSTIMFLGVFRRKTVALLVFLPMAMTGIIAVALNLMGVR